MRVILVPITIPLHVRSLVAGKLALVAAVLFIVAVTSDTWIELRATATSQDTAQQVASVKYNVGIEMATGTLCLHSVNVGITIQPCESSHVVFASCPAPASAKQTGTPSSSAATTTTAGSGSGGDAANSEVDFNSPFRA